MKEKLIGKITHYYREIGVAIVELAGTLKKGDKIHIKGSTTDFEQEADSMQIDHADINQANKKDLIGMKVEQKVRNGDKIYLVLS